MKISIVKGRDRKENIKRAIKLIEKDIEKIIKIKKSKQLFIKINTVDIKLPLACTHIDALESVLDIFYDKFEKIIVGDNSFAFTKDKGKVYKKILNNFPKVKFSDLTKYRSEDIEFKTLDKIKVGRISLLPKESFTISLALPKTHDSFVYTGCLKNMFGCVISNRSALHTLSFSQRLFHNKYIRSNKLKWDNLVNVINKTKPDLCILDAYVGMDGNGPLLGDKVQLDIAMCSLDGIALDKLASKICGLDYVPYLSMLPDVHTEIIKEGFEDINEINKKFKPHYNHKYMVVTDIDSVIPLLDVRFIISVLKRPHRIKDKIIEKIREINTTNGKIRNK